MVVHRVFPYYLYNWFFRTTTYDLFSKISPFRLQPILRSGDESHKISLNVKKGYQFINWDGDRRGLDLNTIQSNTIKVYWKFKSCWLETAPSTVSSQIILLAHSLPDTHKRTKPSFSCQVKWDFFFQTFRHLQHPQRFIQPCMWFIHDGTGLGYVLFGPWRTGLALKWTTYRVGWQSENATVVL